jgi:hypothetical protein
MAIVEPLATISWGIRRFSLIDPNGARMTIIVHTGRRPRRPNVER